MGRIAPGDPFLSTLDNSVVDLLRRCDDANNNNNKNKHAHRPTCLTVELILQYLYQTHFHGEGQAVLPDHLPFGLEQLPHLHQRAVVQARLTAHVVAAVSTRPIVTLYELEREACCRHEVQDFEELGFGPSLRGLPVVQQFFQVSSTTPIFPVESSDVYHYLMHHPEMVVGSGDAKDLVRGFAHYYETNLLVERRRNTPSLPTRITNPRQLGIHVHDLPTLLATLRQEMMNAQQWVQQHVIAAARTHFSRNTGFYVKMVQSMDHMLQEMNDGASPSRTPSATFSVNMSEEEVLGTTLPLSWWKASSSSLDGGVELPVQVGHASTTAYAVVHPSSMVQEAQPSSSLVAASGVAAPPAAARNIAALRRRRGVIRSDAADNMTVSAPTPVVLHNTTPLPTTTTTMGNPLAASTSSLTTTDAVVVPPSPVVPSSNDVLRKILAAPFDLDAAVEALNLMTIGEHLNVKVLRNVYRGIYTCTCAMTVDERTNFFASIAATPYVVVAAPTSQTSVAVVVMDLASPEEVCWEAPHGLQDDDLRRFGRHLCDSIIYRGGSNDGDDDDDDDDSSLQQLLLEFAQIPRHGSIAAWLAACRCFRRCTSPRRTMDASTCESWQRIMMSCITDDFDARMAQHNNDPHAALRALLASLPEEAHRTLTVFAVDGRWWRGMDEIFSCGTRFLGVSGLRLQPSLAEAPPLHVMRFGEEPHVAVMAVLRHCGVASLDEATHKMADFATPLDASDAIHLHRIISAVVPYAQGLLHERGEVGYLLGFEELQTRLQAFRVVMGKNVRVRELLRLGRYRYVMEQRAALCYVAQHHTLYGEAADVAPNTLADTIAPLFLPWSVSAHTRQTLVELLHQLFAILWVLPSTEEVEAAGERLDRAAARLGVCAFHLEEKHGHVKNGNDDGATRLQKLPSLVLTSPPFTRYSPHFPPGSDGCGTPSTNNNNNSNNLAELLSSMGVVSKASRLRPGNFSVRSLPSWRSTFFEELPRTLTEVQQHARRSAAVHDDDDDDDDEDDVVDGLIQMGQHGRKRSREETGSTPRMLASRVDQIQEVSRIAERFVYEQLRAQHQHHPQIHVVWVNEDGEQGTPYDIVVLRSERREVMEYVEVKSTVSANGKDFQISLREMLLAARYGEAFCVYRVFNSGSAHSAVFTAARGEFGRMRSERLADIIGMWHRGRLTIACEAKVSVV